MKATKALKRLAKIEASMSDVVERYVSLAPAVRKALQDAMAAVSVAKEAVSLEVSDGTGTDPPLEQPETTSKAMPGLPKAKRKVSAAEVPKEVAVSRAKTATKTRAPVRKAVVKAKKAPAPARAAAKPVG